MIDFRGRERQKEREGEYQADSLLSMELDRGSQFHSPETQSELKPRVKYPNNYATQMPQFSPSISILYYSRTFVTTKELILILHY